jgi:hypothetical protein
MISVFDKQASRPRPGWFDEHAEAWVEHGLMTTEQLEAIRAFEHVPEYASVGDESTTTSRFSLVAELAVYLGSVIALMSGAMIVGQTWESLTTAARAGIGVAVAALGFVAGERLVRLDDAARTRRLASFMWLIGTGGVALATATVADRAQFDEPAWTVVIVGVPVLAIGAALWRNLDRPLQVLTTAVGAGLVIGGTGALLSTPAWLGGVIVWSIAFAVGVLAITQRLRPELYVLGVASIAAMIGALMLIDVSELVGTSIATATAAGIVAVALARRLTPILVIGVLAFLQSLQGLLLTTLNGAVAALVVAVAGIAVVVVVIARSTRRGTPHLT